MENNKEILRMKLALFSMIDQFMYEVTIDGVEYFDDYCESAGEKAFSCLGFEDDRISKTEFYNKYDDIRNQLFHIIDNDWKDEYVFSDYHRNKSTNTDDLMRELSIN